MKRGKSEARLQSRTAIAGVAITAVACNGRDDAVRRDATYTVAGELVYEIDVAVRRNHNIAGVGDLSLGSWPAIAAKTRRAGSCDGRDDAVGVYAADALVLLVADIDAA